MPWPRPGESATSINYTNYALGINGIAIDVAPGDTFGGLDVGDFELRVGNGDDPSLWTSGPEPIGVTTLAGAGDGDPVRVLLALPNGTALGAWLQVTIRATAQNGLFEDDVFYLGNAVGETGNSGAGLPTPPLVNAADVIAIRDNPRGRRNPASIDNPYDVDRDGLVNAVDLLLARNFATSPLDALQLISVPIDAERVSQFGEGSPIVAAGALESLPDDRGGTAATPPERRGSDRRVFGPADAPANDAPEPIRVRATSIIFGDLGRKTGGNRLQWGANVESADPAEPIVDALAQLLADRKPAQ